MKNLRSNCLRSRTSPKLQLERTLRILILFSRRNEWSCEELSQALNVSQGTLFHDFDCLRAAGFTILKRLDACATFLRLSPRLTIATLPTEEEYLSLLIAMQHAKSHLTPAEMDPLESLLEKLTALNPAPSEL